MCNKDQNNEVCQVEHCFALVYDIQYKVNSDYNKELFYYMIVNQCSMKIKIKSSSIFFPKSCKEGVLT